MKTKTRRIIGNILVWGGLATLSWGNVIAPFLVGYGSLDSSFISTNTTYNITVNLFAIIALLIGGLWGMRRGK